MKNRLHAVARSAAAALLAVFASIAASCAGFAGDPAPGPDPAAREIATGARLIEAYRADKASDFLKALPNDVKEKFGEREFKATRAELTESMGEIVSYHFLTTLNAPGFRTHVWRVVFERGETLDSARKVRQETLFRIVTMTPKNGAEPYIITFGFL